MNVQVNTANELIGGTSLTAEDIEKLLKKARFDAEKLDENTVEVTAGGKKFILTKDPEFLGKFRKDSENPQVIFLDQNKKGYQEF